MTNNFAELTVFIPKIKDDAFGEWVADMENDGTPERPIQIPFMHYSETVNAFVGALYQYCEAHPEFEHTGYSDTLKSYGLEWNLRSMEAADVRGMDTKGVIALLIGAVRAEKFCDGALLTFFQKGCILRWLERLAKIDSEQSPTND